MDAPNLDDMTTDPRVLWDFGIKLERATIRSKESFANAQRLFGRTDTAARKAARSFGHYAANKATAMRCRIAGDVQAALIYEAICDQIYSGLPEFAKW